MRVEEGGTILYMVEERRGLAVVSGETNSSKTSCCFRLSSEPEPGGSSSLGVLV